MKKPKENFLRLALQDHSIRWDKLFKKKVLAVFIFLFFCSFSFAQKQITGVVKDAANGTAIEGVSILKNQVPITQTNANGEFSIEATIGDSLRFTAIGMQPVSQTVDQ